MKKVGICVDNYKLHAYRIALDETRLFYWVENLTKGTKMIYLMCPDDTIEDIERLVKKSNIDSKRSN